MPREFCAFPACRCTRTRCSPPRRGTGLQARRRGAGAAPAHGLVHNAAFDGSLLAYDADYQNEQGHSPTFQTHLDDMLDLMDLHFAGRSVIEVGCGKGVFLALLRERGHSATGIDPTYEGNDPHIRRELFTPATKQQADALVLRHTLEHVDDPHSFLTHIRDANGGSGLIYIEVPCLDWILTHRAWFDFFYEHVNYFRLSDFHRLFGTVLESGRLFGGQYLYVVADLATLRPCRRCRLRSGWPFPRTCSPRSTPACPVPQAGGAAWFGAVRPRASSSRTMQRSGSFPWSS